MRAITQVLLVSLATLSSAPTWAWELTLQENDTIQVNNQRQLNQVDVYLTWFDKDARSAQKQFLSWTLDKGWQPELIPVTGNPLDLTPFEMDIPDKLKTRCPEEHRCFLALVAVKQGEDPLNDKAWQASTLLPLTLEAGRDRLPSQAFFLPSDGEARNLVDFEESADSITAGGEVPQAAPAVADDAKNASALATEKPDIFRLVGDKVLYANGQAERFQVIDVANPNQPQLQASTTLTGSPRELYTLDGYYILLQTDYTAEAGTHITVLAPAQGAQLTTVADMTLKGNFIESRRRGNVIYAVTESYLEQPMPVDQGVAVDEPMCFDCGIRYQPQMTIQAIELMDNGQLQTIDQAELTGNGPIVAIFSDYLVIANHDPQDWGHSQIQVYDLSSEADAVRALPVINVAGVIPSEFHLNVQDQKLHVVYGPQFNKEGVGSTLAIYDLTATEPTLIGQVGDIAPNEALFATRFAGNYAYVVTYERTDPLWVIDLADPTQPKIMGELKVPGWSEKLFFNEGLLFAVGIHDQPESNETEDKRVRRVAMSLFDVSNPTQPQLLSRFVPMAGQVNWNYSPALDDERALLLNWPETFAALPLESWETEASSHLQVVSFANDVLENAGLISSPVPLQRSVPLTANILAALGDQALLTVQWGSSQTAQVLAELELAINVSRLKQQQGSLWAAAQGNNGLYRLYRYAPTDLENPAQRINLAKSYQGMMMAEGKAVFYNINPLAIQVVDLNSGQAQPAQQLEQPPVEQPPVIMEDGVTEEDVERIAANTGIVADIMPYPIWFDRREPLIHDNTLYVAEQQQLDLKERLPHIAVPEQTWQAQWILKSWSLNGYQPGSQYTIPGTPIAFTADDQLVTQEYTEQGQMRLNLLVLEADKARLVDSSELPCQSYSSQVYWDDEALYISCVSEINYLVPPEEGAPHYNTALIKLNPGEEFTEQGRWTLTGHQTLQAVNDDVVLVSASGGPIWFEDTIAVKAEMSIMPYPYSPGCDVYQLVADAEPQLLKHLETCPWQEQVVLTPEHAWMAQGFAGIELIDW